MFKKSSSPSEGEMFLPIPSFRKNQYNSDKVEELLRAIVSNLIKHGSTLTIDLRNNPGGEFKKLDSFLIFALAS